MDPSSIPPTGVSTAPTAVAGPSGAGGAGAGAAPRTKSKAYQTTIAAEADDLKYESKYKELKKKVREVEEDNEQLYVKILQAQQSIQRLRLERAIIYERLAAISPPSGGGGHPTQDNGSTPAHQPPSNNSAPPGPSSSSVLGPGAGGSSTPHHPHPLSQSFTPTSHSHSHSQTHTQPHSTPHNGGSAPTASGSSVPARAAPPHHQQQYSPPQSSKHGSTLPQMDIDIDGNGHGGPYGKGIGREYEYEQRERVHNGHANGMTLPPISPSPARGIHGKAEAW